MFITNLSCDLCLRTKSLWHIPSWCFSLSYDGPGNKHWKQEPLFFSSWKLPLGAIFTNLWQVKNCTIFVPFGPFVAICASASSQKQPFGFILELPVEWLLYLSTCLFSSYACFCLLFSALFWINSFCCWTLKSRSRNCIRWCHVCSSLYSISQIVDNHLVTQLSPIIWYILSNPSPLY